MRRPVSPFQSDNTRAQAELKWPPALEMEAMLNCLHRVWLVLGLVATVSPGVPGSISQEGIFQLDSLWRPCQSGHGAGTQRLKCRAVRPVLLRQLTILGFQEAHQAHQCGAELTAGTLTPSWKPRFALVASGAAPVTCTVQRPTLTDPKAEAVGNGLRWAAPKFNGLFACD